MRTDRVHGIIGLAARAGGVVRGTERVREAVRENTVRFALVAADASRNSKNRIVPLLEASGVPYVERFDRESLGSAIGKAPVSALAVTDPGFAAQLRAAVGAAVAAPETGFED